MPRILYTVQNLVDETRSLLDEQDTDSVKTEQDILTALNRGQDYALDIYARRYPEPILTYSTLTLVGGVAEYDIPENVFEDRIVKIEIATGGSSFPEVERISFRDISEFEGPGTTAIPEAYCIIGRKIRFIRTPSGTYSCRLWYLRNPERLVLPQGRITKLNTASNYVILDEIGASLTTESDQLGSYVNWVDGQTGEIKSTLQIATVNENRIGFRNIATRSSVLNRTVSSSIPSSGAEDDYLAAIEGTCVPYYGRPTSNFLIHFAVTEIAGKLGEMGSTQEDVLKNFEKQVERTWVGRERQMRVQRRSSVWRRNHRVQIR